MQTIKHIVQEKIQLFLFIIPALYFIIGSYFRYILGDLSLRSLDPDYIYFITGLGISEGHINVLHVDNPGTPLQYLMGLTYRLVYLLRPGNGSYLEDVLKNSDLYMAVSNSVITGLITALLFYAGRRIYKSTGSVFYGLLIQTTPFLAVIWYDIIGRIVPELLMPLPVILLEIFLIEIIYSGKKVEDNMQIIVLAAISAIGLSVKLTYLPLWFIPLIIIRNWKRKALFAGLSILFFLLFAIPVTLRLGVFTGWIKSLFIHSGQYGGGEANFINWTEFGANLKFLWGYEKWFLITTFLTLGTALGYFLFRRKEADSKLLLVAASVITTILLQTIMVGKHFEHRYYIPSLLLFPVLVFLIAEMAKRMLKGKFQILVSMALLIFLIAFFVHQQPWIKLKAETMSTDMAQRQETRNFVAAMNPNSIKIITTQNYGSPFKEYALMISYAWSGGHQKYYTETLAKLYPDSYLFFTWDNTFRFWGTELNMTKINDSKKPVFVYLENDNPELYKKTIERLTFVPDSIKVTPELLFQNEKTKETIYRLNFNAKADSISTQ
ncbi:MAG: hypothetical protein C0397_09640 [Odoribacter sp.]|nr:hypothetical protein [Odoribacter sp.]